MKNNEALPLDRAVIAANIRTTRLAQGLTQHELAEQSGVNVLTIFRAEKGLPVSPKTLRKISKAMGGEFEGLCTAKGSLNRVSKDCPFIISAPHEMNWVANEDKRKNIPKNNHELIQSSQERMRLGGLGMVKWFSGVYNFKVTGGPAAMLIELYGCIEEGLNVGIVENCILHCLRGEVIVTLGESKVTLSEGAALGYKNRDDMRFEPARAVGINELPPLLMLIGADPSHKTQVRPKSRKDARP